MAATANATALRNSSWSWTPRYRPSPIEITSATPAMTRIWLVSASSCLVSGVFSMPVALSIPLMWPTSVAMPVVVTRMVPAPRVTWQFMNAMSTRSPSAASAATAVDLLGRRHALAGQRGFVDLERRGGQDAGVGRDEIARLDVHDVARDELVHRDLGELAVAPDLRLDDHHALERRGARLRLALLVHGHPGVEQGEQDQEDAGEELPRQEQADDAGDQQHDLHRVGVLADEHLPLARPSSPRRRCSCRPWRDGNPPRRRSGHARGRRPADGAPRRG